MRAKAKYVKPDVCTSGMTLCEIILKIVRKTERHNEM